MLFQTADNIVSISYYPVHFWCYIFAVVVKSVMVTLHAEVEIGNVLFSSLDFFLKKCSQNSVIL